MGVTHLDPPADLARTRGVDAATGYGLPKPPLSYGRMLSGHSSGATVGTIVGNSLWRRLQSLASSMPISMHTLED